EGVSAQSILRGKPTLTMENKTIEYSTKAMFPGSNPIPAAASFGIPAGAEKPMASGHMKDDE
ncbi:MAG: hypothetical protein WCY36_05045, partial [Candidatus Omnitrophota bacterium]